MISVSELIRGYQRAFPIGWELAFRFWRFVIATFVHALLAAYCFAILWLGYSVLNQAPFRKDTKEAVFLIAVIFTTFFWSVAYRVKSKVESDDIEIGITRDEAPGLFKILDEVKREFKNQRISRVRLMTRFNCSTRIRRAPWSLFSTKHDLFLSWPLITMLSKQQLRAVIAHEMAHFQSSNLSPSWWVKKASDAAWLTRNLAVFLPVQFLLDHLEKRLRALAFFAIQHREKLADLHAARVTDPLTCRNTLMRVELLMGLSPEDYQDCDELFRIESPTPLDNYCRKMCQFLSSTLTSTSKVKSKLDDKLLAITNSKRSHPSIAERLQVIGYDSVTIDDSLLSAVMTEHSSAGLLAGDGAESIRQQVDQAFKDETKASREYWHRQILMSRERQDDDWDARSLHPADLWWHYRCQIAGFGEKAARRWIVRIVEQHPDSDAAHTEMAALDLQWDRHGNVDWAVNTLLRQTDSDDCTVADKACCNLVEHFQMTGDSERLKKIEAKQDGIEERMWRLGRKYPLTLFDHYAPADFSSRQLHEIVKAFKRLRVRRIWVGQQTFRHSPSLKYYIFVIECLTSSQIEVMTAFVSGHAALEHILHVEPNKHFRVIPIFGRSFITACRIRRTAGSLIYDRRAKQVADSEGDKSASDE